MRLEEINKITKIMARVTGSLAYLHFNNLWEPILAIGDPRFTHQVEAMRACAEELLSEPSVRATLESTFKELSDETRD